MFDIKLSKIVLSVTSFIIMTAIYVLAVTYFMHLDITYFYDGTAVLLSFIVPLILTYFSVTELDLRMTLKKHKTQDQDKYFKLLLAVLKIYRTNILKSFMVTVTLSAVSIAVVYDDPTMWGPSVSLFLLSGFYSAVQCFLIFSIFENRFSLRILMLNNEKRCK